MTPRVLDDRTDRMIQYETFAILREPQAIGPHIGFTTPRALGKAVVRNRIRRRVREAVRLHLEQLSPEWSIVFNPRRKAMEAPFPELEREVQRLFQRCSGW